MANVIQLLPDSVANQIAAGEVIQRPASVVKELVENAIDAGGKNITIQIKDAGKTLIQVVDDGQGMSETDARMAFERHATSKIKNADDLFHILTKGFRGEALASIAAVAQVYVQTRQEKDDVGVEIEIHGSKLLRQEPAASAKGTNFQVKNLFYNVPARRKFLKSPSTEFRHIVNEFNRVALVHADIHFKLIHNNQVVQDLIPSNFRQRIINLFGKQMTKNLVPVHTETSIITIEGFICKPETAKKSFGEQYFFINNRYMRHPVFHKAISNAYKGLLPSDAIPGYFIEFTAPPESIDVNIHPTKTEIKFESEQGIFQILEATVKEGLGKANFVPSIDFETQGVIEIPTLTRNTEIKPPQIHINPDYNPFKDENNPAQIRQQQNTENWETLYKGFEGDARKTAPTNGQAQSSSEPAMATGSFFMQVLGRYIATPVKSGLLLINQKRAHECILFEKYIQCLMHHQSVTQESLFPTQIELSPEDYQLALELQENINNMGFDIQDFGSNTIVVNGYPSVIDNPDPETLIKNIIAEYKNNLNELKSDYKLNLAKSMASAASIGYGQQLTQHEMNAMVDELFACKDHQYSPSGKPVMAIIETDEIEKKFKK